MPGRILFTATTHVLAALLLLVVAGYWFDRPVWNALRSTLALIGLFAAAYVVCAAALTLFAPRGRTRLLQTALAGIAAFGVAFMAVLFAEWRWPDTFAGELPRGYAFTATTLGIALLVLIAWAREWPNRKLAWVLPALLVVSVAIPQYTLRGGATLVRSVEVAFLETSRYVVKVTTHERRVTDRARGGAIAAIGDGYLIAAGGGTMYLAEPGKDSESLELRELAYRTPINYEEFGRAGREAFGDGWTDHGHRERLRIGDVVVQERPGDTVRVFVSHHYWKDAEKCYAVRVSMLEGSRDELLGEEAGLEWRTLYESRPCLEFNSDGHRGAWFAGYQIGGAMALLDEEKLLVAVGDHEYDGWNRSPLLPQDADSPYGKLMLIDVASGQAEMYSLGHRNPQGMFVDDDGAVWSTEHGPRGGDELNQVTRGANYGWPLATYGTEYWLDHWPVGNTPNSHAGFEGPVFSFVPSIALSALTGISGDLFAAWEGDLLLASLSGELARVRVENGRAVVVEMVTLGGRLRDVAQGRDGRLALWTDRQDVILVEPADAHSPQALVKMCAGCHTFNRRETSSIGPNLWEIVGAPVADDSEFDYSRAMRDFGGRWSRQRLDAFLADPAATVPGTSMQFDGIDDAEDRERLIDFLEGLR